MKVSSAVSDPGILPRKCNSKLDILDMKFGLGGSENHIYDIYTLSSNRQFFEISNDWSGSRGCPMTRVHLEKCSRLKV
jgi:hypothetical protein